MDGLKQWALTLIIGGLAGTFAMAIAPNGAASKTLRTVIGIFIVMIICAPLTDLKDEDSFLPVFNESGDISASDEEENLKEYMVSACRESVKTEIGKVASELGASVSNAEINMYIDDEYCIIIQDVLIKTDYAHTGKLSSALSERLGVPVRIIS